MSYSPPVTGVLRHRTTTTPSDMMQMVGIQFGSTANTTTTDPMAAIAAVTSASTLSPSCGFDGEAATAFGGGGSGRWLRQETLTLLEIRSRLDPKFKEANQKGPLWDEVSRIMLEEHGYQRIGKKCREKFENLYKYYKKTKEVKAGREDGEHYRFFRQLEALYGDDIPATTMAFQAKKLTLSATTASLVPPNSKLARGMACETDEDAGAEGRGEGFKGRTVERKEEASRIDRQHKFWAKERAWIEARDAALMEALQNLNTKQLKASENHNEKEEAEVSKLIQLRTAMEARFQQGGFHEEDVMTSNKKRKENSRGFDYYQLNESLDTTHQANDGSSHGVNDSCFRFFMADGDNNLWENYGLKLSN
ncbi:hypothetical protein F3Y22_tig00111587pilonHSYRG00065 [Hibiscus syriacus]|uniref:Myb-like domain-containing protein n=1 Tax=Hibiscus syriacus TaxID=106335 RepID=A0A6A2YJI6_HIBSY|nr:hypothetical protein F3Y22_tig00111587pilonHSYRG00065 [Hibiscus syriacus]